MAERFVVIGLARVRSPWFTEVAQWSHSAQLPVEFLKCVGAGEVRARLGSGRAVSALLVDGGVAGLDRDLIDEARRRSTAVLVVADGRVHRDWMALGATAVLPETFDAATLLTCLGAHAQLVRTAVGPDGVGAVRPDPGSTADLPSSWRGDLVAVTGARGTGTSTVAMALAQGWAAVPGNTGSVALADLAGRGDLAMYHDVGDVMPGLQELVEAHGSATPTRATVRSMLFDVEERGYSVLLGLRRSRDWTALRPRALHATIESLRATFRAVVADLRCETDGEEETGSVDIEELNGATRRALADAGVVVVCGDASLKGLHGLVRAERDVTAFGVAPDRIVRVVTRAPRSPRQRAEVSRALTELGSGAGSHLGIVHLPERRNLDVVHRVAGPLPRQLVDPVTRAVAVMLDGGR